MAPQAINFVAVTYAELAARAIAEGRAARTSAALISAADAVGPLKTASVWETRSSSPRRQQAFCLTAPRRPAAFLKRAAAFPCHVPRKRRYDSLNDEITLACLLPGALAFKRSYEVRQVRVQQLSCEGVVNVFHAAAQLLLRRALTLQDLRSFVRHPASLISMTAPPLNENGGRRPPFQVRWQRIRSSLTYARGRG
jgi:hypothetical protein